MINSAGALRKRLNPTCRVLSMDSLKPEEASSTCFSISIISSTYKLSPKLAKNRTFIKKQAGDGRA
jgi:hypothetical protein